MGRHLAMVMVAGWSSIATAQLSNDASLEQADALAAQVSATLDCEVELVGGIRTDELVGHRYIAYVASGAECDTASRELSERGSELDLVFLRRPNLAQLRALVADMIRSVEMTTGCRVSLRGTPALDETTSRWLVTYVTSGDNCNEAGQELRDLGRDLDIAFLG